MVTCVGKVIVIFVERIINNCAVKELKAHMFCSSRSLPKSCSYSWNRAKRYSIVSYLLKEH